MICSLRRLVAPLAFLALAPAARAQHPAMPAGMTHDQHVAQMKAKGEAAMGFDQDATVHQFRLTPDGGSIAVDAKTGASAATRAQVRSHLAGIAVAFAQGDFGTPLMTHGEEPPGVPVLRRLKAQLTYRYQDSARGGRVRIETADAEALSALHAFLRYQITEHATGDPLTIGKC